MLLSIWGHINSIPTVGNECEHSNRAKLLTHSLLRWQENGSERQNVSSTDLLPAFSFLAVSNPQSSVVGFIVGGQRSGAALTLSLLFLLKKMEKLEKLWKTVYGAADLLRGSPFFPIHGNEERAINWTPQGGSAQQRGGGREGRGETVQCCEPSWAISATQASASLKAAWYLSGN